MLGTESVVGWDGSREADGALEWAAVHAERTGLDVRAVLVLPQETDGDPARRVSEARAALNGCVSELADRHPLLHLAAQLLVGDPAVELGRFAGRDHLLVMGASEAGRFRRPEARRVPIRLAARGAGATAIVPARGAPDGRGVLGVVTGRDHSRATIEFAFAAARARREPLTFVRIHDPHDLDVSGDPIHLDTEIARLRSRDPRLEIRLDPGWLHSPWGVLTRSDGASLLVLEGNRPSAAPPRFSFERWLAAHARAPFVVVADPIAVGAPAEDGAHVGLAIAGHGRSTRDP